MKKCEGCGVYLQSENPNKIGFITSKNLDKNLCERCFRIRNYHDYKFVNNKNSDYIPILNKISKTGDLVILVVDLFNINYELKDIFKYLNNDILLVLTKRDLLPKSVYDLNLLNYFDNFKLKIIDKIIISSKNNFNFDLLIEKINKYKKSNNVYVVGFTNAGKSTMINKLIYNYSDNKSYITTSILPSTTLNSINIKLNDNITLIDTPGLLDEGNIINSIDKQNLKLIIPNKEIKPITYQIKTNQSIICSDLFRIDVPKNNSLTFYMSNNLKYERYYKDTNKLQNLKKHVISVDDDNDIVINGLGFIKIVKKTKITVYISSNIKIYKRKSLI